MIFNNPKKENKMQKEKCKKEVWNGYNHGECLRKAVRDEYCWQHHPDSVAKREKLSEERYQKQLESSPIMKLEKANAKIKKLKKENEELKMKLLECGL